MGKKISSAALLLIMVIGYVGIMASGAFSATPPADQVTITQCGRYGAIWVRQNGHTHGTSLDFEAPDSNAPGYVGDLTLDNPAVPACTATEIEAAIR